MPIVSQRTGKDERARLYPAELLPVFDDAFVASWDLFEEYTARLALDTFRALGLEQACIAPVTVVQAAAAAKLDATVAHAPVAWLCALLETRGWLASNEGAYYLERPLPALDPQEIYARQEAHDARCLPSYRIVALAAQHYPAVLRGETAGERALFEPEGIIAWVKYFSNGNPLYAVSNSVGAIAAERMLPAGEAAILEIGGGLGSGAEALLERVQSRTRTRLTDYRFTEISALFLKRAQRTLSSRFPSGPCTFAALDIDGSFAGHVKAGAYALVYGVNVLHVARDLAATLHELRNALMPGGALVMAECVRPFHARPVYPEFVFNLLKSFRDPLLVPGWRPNGGFLTPEQWIAALEANGFADVRIYPDVASIRDAYPSFAVAAITARRA